MELETLLCCLALPRYNIIGKSGGKPGGDERELLMTQVLVFDTSEENEGLVQVDTIPVLYLGLDRKNAVLEFRRVP